MKVFKMTPPSYRLHFTPITPSKWRLSISIGTVVIIFSDKKELSEYIGQANKRNEKVNYEGVQ